MESSGSISICLDCSNAFFKNIFRKQYQIINIKDLTRFKSGEIVDGDTLLKAGLLKRAKATKLLGEGDVSYPLTVMVSKVSQTAREKIESAGGKVEVVSK